MHHRIRRMDASDSSHLMPPASQHKEPITIKCFVIPSVQPPHRKATPPFFVLFHISHLRLQLPFPVSIPIHTFCSPTLSHTHYTPTTPLPSLSIRTPLHHHSMSSQHLIRSSIVEVERHQTMHVC